MGTYRGKHSFGKVDYDQIGRKVNTVTVEITIRPFDKEALPHLFISANIWNASHTDCVACGQILEEVAELLPDNPTLQFIYSMWKQYHMKAVNLQASEVRMLLALCHEL